MLNACDPEADGRDTPQPRIGTVLIVEDDGLLAMMTEDLVRDMGAAEVLVASDLEAAAAHVERGEIDCAILDVLIRNRSTYGIADQLTARNTPFIFCSGIVSADIEERHRHRPLLTKPFSDEDLRRGLRQLFAA